MIIFHHNYIITTDTCFTKGTVYIAKLNIKKLKTEKNPKMQKMGPMGPFRNFKIIAPSLQNEGMFHKHFCTMLCNIIIEKFIEYGQNR